MAQGRPTVAPGSAVARPGRPPVRPAVVLVTGANRGIGRELVRRLALRGDTPVMAVRDIALGWAAARELRVHDGVRVDVVRLDVTDPVSCSRAADEVRRCHGRVDVLVNNAAAPRDVRGTAAAADLDVVQRAWEVDVLGAWRATQAFLPLLRRSAAGRVVNVSAEAGSLANMGGGAPAFRVSKTALNALTRMLAAELGREGIAVNSVCPGWVATDARSAGGRSAEDAAASVLRAVDLPPGGTTGDFLRDGRRLPW
ncbi:SDR family NAD(P)-dependent oxidoreductase [Geodermatophilus sp. SYSU D00814]